MDYCRVKVPHSFFRKAQSEYRDWRFAFFREAIQNAYDAGARRIDFTVAPAPEAGAQAVRVSCRDDGCGMDKTTLIEVLLCLGGSQKDADAIGGFGYAKNLLFFSQDSYQIQTREHRIEGTGGEYWYTCTDTPIKGTAFEVTLSNDTEGALGYELTQFVQRCRLARPVIFTLNGEKLGCHAETYPFRLDTNLGELAFRDSTSSVSQLWVYVRGLPMFPHTVWTDQGTAFEGRLELAGDPLVALTANRDGLRGDVGRMLHTLFQTLAAERTRLKLSELIDVTLNPGSAAGAQLRLASSASSSADPAPADTSEHAPQDATPEPGRRVTCTQIPNLAGEGVAAFRGLRDKARSRHTHIQARLARLDATRYPHNFRIKTTASTHANARYTPAAVAQSLDTLRLAKLAYRWSVILANVLRTPSLEAAGVTFEASGGYWMSDKPIRFGFVFDPHVEGLCTMTAPEITLCLNPCLVTKDTRFEDLVDVAIHESAHLRVSGHDETFCTLEQRIRRELRRIVRPGELERHARDLIRSRV